MIPYWTIFAFAALLSLRDISLPVALRGRAAHLSVIVIAVALLVGLRYDVGGDWGSYQGYLFQMRYLDFFEMLEKKDPGYQLLNYIANALGAGIWLVNLASAAIFCWGLWRFARTLPSPSLAVLVAIPYLVIVVAMGYTRQAVAIGFIMAAFAALRSNRFLTVAALLLLAVLFHRTAVIIVPIIALSRANNRGLSIAAFGLLAVVLYYVFLDDAVDSLVTNYVERSYDSTGAMIRITMNAIPAALFILFGRRFPLAHEDEYKLWRNMAFAALACVPALFLVGSTTVIDRLALYVIPIQLFVLSWLPLVFGRNLQDNRPMVAAVLLYSAAIQFVWLNFAGHSDEWVPYRFYPLAVGSPSA
ncbi:EpsG family protein [Sphingomonas gilva]|uniref:EpsG family protein n=1 Tax=Sphingomonas gilva TaxID=2305907 RepID=A0A396RZX7_9SPHN|nr:EpsG family protein [Sphingomonas gilva]RHW16655.1 EpsG family protein [Sphingomonas gilva]